MDPQGDAVHYHQWWDDLQHDYPFLIKHKLTEPEKIVCHGTIVSCRKKSDD